MRLTSRGGLLVLGLGLVLGACSSSTSNNSGGSVPNATQLQSKANAVASAFTAAPMLGLSSIPLSAFAGLSHGGGPNLAALSVAPIRMFGKAATLGQRWGTVRQFMSQVRPAGHTLRTMGDAIDDTKYTTEFAINQVTGAYEDDGTNAGPANGVRYILYAVDQNFNLDPTTPVGYADLLDVSTVNTTGVQTVVQGGNGNATNFANYTTSITDPQVTPTDPSAFGVTGNVGAASSTALNLAVTDDGAGTTTLDISADAASGLSMALTGTDAIDQQGNVQDQGTISFTNGSDQITIDGSEQDDAQGTPTLVDWTVSVNGTQVATASAYNSNGDLVWLDSHGDPLTQRDLNVLNFLFFLAFGVTFEVLLLGLSSLIIASA
jgi:hypothetical protein